MNTVRYRYNQQAQPPAPFIYVVIHHPVGQAATERLPALIDSGADITAIPAAVADRLGLVKFSAGSFCPDLQVQRSCRKLRGQLEPA